MAAKYISTEERFRSFLAPPNENGCILWLGPMCVGGRGKLKYGRLNITQSPCHYKMKLAHRLAWELVYGPIPRGLCVCHTCDVPPCVNIEHLFLATRAENHADMCRKGRHGYTRLTAEQVRIIRTQHANGIPQSQLARKYGVTAPTIYAVVHRQTHKTT